MSPFRLFSTFPFSLFSGKAYVPQNASSMSHSVPKSQVAIFAAGCFWGVEHIFLKQWPIKEDKGILKSAVGYTGGRADSTDPSYRDVCLGTTNHAEALRIEFDPSKVTYDELVGPSVISFVIAAAFLMSCCWQSISIVPMTLQPSIPKAQIAAPVCLVFFPPHSSLTYPTYIQSTALPYFSTPQSKSRLPAV
jgi:hypothetical protein